MFTNMTLGTKILCGFSAILVILLILGTVAIHKMNLAADNAEEIAKEQVPELALLAESQAAFMDMAVQLRVNAMTHDKTAYEKSMKELAELKQHVAKLKELDLHAVHLADLKRDLPKLISNIDEFESALKANKEADDQLQKDTEDLKATGANMIVVTDDYVQHFEHKFQKEIEGLQNAQQFLAMSNNIYSVNDLRDEIANAKLGLYTGLHERNIEKIELAERQFEPIFKHIAAFKAGVKEQDSLRELNDIKRGAEKYHEAVKDLIANWKKAEAASVRMSKEEEDVRTLILGLQEAGSAVIEKEAEADRVSLSLASTNLIVGLILAVLVGGFMGFFITRSITISTSRVAEVIANGSEQVAAASRQLAAASQQMAEGASEQAASIEETSSSLEEMSTMTSQNSEHAIQAQSISEKSRKAALQGDKVMLEMNNAINEIKLASDDVGEIIKTIEEIAFQTNLLALNAAVEAARAGEAGKGFAVVADEVRALAQRAANAARESATKIESAIQRSNVGVETAKRVAETLTEISANVKSTNDLICEIAAASKEQSQGIGQVNIAVQQIDKVVQSNAANSEEAASASEEMSAQAETLREAVDELARMVGISTSRSFHNGNGNGHSWHRRQIVKSASNLHKTGNGNGNGLSTEKHEFDHSAIQRNQHAAEMAIPMGEESHSEGGFKRF